AWNEALDLSMTVRNRSSLPATVPLAAETPPPPSSPDAEQVAALLDLADFLEVLGPDGCPVRFHVDPPGADPAMETIIRNRADSPPSSRLEPGRSLQHRASNLNRGWARYPLLHEGTYCLTLAYTPEWDDEEFTRAGVGALRSNTVKVVVTRGAHAGVSGPGAALQAVLVQEQEAVVARLENHQDVSIWVNLNFGLAGPPFASLRWVVYADHDWRDCAPPHPPTARPDFAREKLIEVVPAAALELGRMPLAHLRRAAGLQPGEPLFVRVVYSSLTDRAWQREQKNLPAPLRDPLPERLLFITLAGEPLRID
ncbi:MAG: hypothetical protein V2A79_19695, partial [Planctomycetota bacterium]